MTGNLRGVKAFSRGAVIRLLGAAMLAGVLGTACEPAPRVGASRPGGDTGRATFTVISQEIFVPRCATGGCHGGSPPANTPALDPDLAYDAIVGVPSATQPAISLVAEGDPAASYLVQKLQSDMPPGDPLDASDLEAVQAWIANGAPND